MSILSIYVVSKSGGMIFNLDYNYPKIETEKVFEYPLELKLELKNKKLIVVFGGNKERNGISAGQTLLSLNSKPIIEAPFLEDGTDVTQFLAQETNYPVTLRFGRTRMNTNEKMFLGSMFYPLYAIASQISPEPHSSGIQVLEAESFTLNCFQTLTGIKFILITEPKLLGPDLILRRVYELYSDYVLKNPFYALEMPIRCDLFTENLKQLFENVEKYGISNI